MKKMFIPIILAIFLCVNLAAFASVPSGSKEDGYISVNANASDEIEPNQAQIVFSIEANNKDITKVTQDLNETSQKLTEVLKSKMSEGDTIKTSTYSVNPDYTYNKDKKRQLNGYIATTKMTVTTKNIPNLSSLIATALNNGATGVDGLDFNSTDINDACNKLIIKASKTALSNAKTVAEAMDSALNGIKNISTSCGTQPIMRAYGVQQAAAANEAADAAPAQPTIEPGTIKINASVYANFYVK